MSLIPRFLITSFTFALVSLGALQQAAESALIEHCRTLSAITPLMGFYLQPAVGGRILPYSFWRSFAEIENAVAVKIAPFNRYQTLDVVRAVAQSGAEERIALYTGNDDSIIVDLLTSYAVKTANGSKTLRIVGGLLGQWSIWTRRAVELLEEIHGLVETGTGNFSQLLEKSTALTDTNAAVFDAAHNFAGCIPGINEVLRRQGLLQSANCLDARSGLSPGQAQELDRVCRDYPFLTDDQFVRQHLDEWLREST
jgi:hypothetical protein